MLWLLNNAHDENYTFAQIFNVDSISTDGNAVYNLDKIDWDTDKIKEIIPKIYSFRIKIIGQLVSFTDLTTNKTFTFSKKENIIKPNENPNGYLIFAYTYKKVDSHRMPELKTYLYDFYYENVTMEIYQINKDTLFVKEKNFIKNQGLNEIEIESKESKTLNENIFTDVEYVSERKYFISGNYSKFKI